LSCVASANARDDSAEHRVRELARRVSTEVPRNKMNCVNWNNHEAVSEARSEELKSAFIEELQPKQGDAGAPAGNCTVSVFLERTPAEVVVTADVENSGDARYFFATIQRAAMPAENVATAPTLRLEKELLWQQSERILDALLVRSENGANDRLIVLQRDSLTLFEKQEGTWKTVQTKPLGQASAMQRVPRGELSFNVDQPDRVKIVFSGKSCQANLNDASPLVCQQSAEAVRTGMLLASKCASRGWWLRADGGDSTTTGRLELLNSAVPQGQQAMAELAMPGPVVSISSGEASRADTAVVFNLATGNYEVYRIALACGQ
jgi:hypothetical protein